MPKKTSKTINPESNEEPQDLSVLLAEAQAKAQEYVDGLQRERADFTNFRRRVEAERSQTWAQASAETIKKILPVLDDLERASANRPAGDSWAEGIEIIIRKFESILEKDGVIRIEALGQPFDPNLHEAIMQEESSEYESGTVTAILQQGYLYREQVLRPAMVKVAA
ncbi:MAG: nucleotide exchange factor GrpE [Anaerolineales bacterium]|jgi:molecular chaperone GrpE|nr:nucleotide exchange factor GrpE [Anaerolineales bacterium]